MKQSIPFFIEDHDFVKKYNKIWDKAINSINKNLIAIKNLTYDKKYLETKTTSYEGKLNRNFHDNGIPKEGSHCICLSVKLIDFIFKLGKNHYSQMFLEKCKYIAKEKR